MEAVQAGGGVSVQTVVPGRKWRLRWRNPDRKQDGMTVEGTITEANALIFEIRTALERGEAYRPERSRILPPPAPVAERPAADFLALTLACIERRENAGKYEPKTATTYRGFARGAVATMRDLEGLPVDAAFPVTLLSRDLFERLISREKARGGNVKVSYMRLRFLLDAWRWAWTQCQEDAAAGRPATWHRLPPSPVETTDYLPRVGRYGRTVAPTLAHVDAMIRQLWTMPKVAHGNKIAAMIMRYTGLRAAQVFAIDRGDIDLTQRLLCVRTGKTAQEKADQRTVPLARALCEDPAFREYVESFGTGPIFPKRNHANASSGPRTKHPTETFKAAWQAATDAGECPLHVWAPPNREIARPEHAFRAAFQAHLEYVRVAGNVIDFLVGHESETVQDAHYGRDLLDDARAAVDALPPVDWTGPGEALPANVHRLHG